MIDVCTRVWMIYPAPSATQSMTPRTSHPFSTAVCRKLYHVCMCICDPPSAITITTPQPEPPNNIPITHALGDHLEPRACLQLRGHLPEVDQLQLAALRPDQRRQQRPALVEGQLAHVVRLLYVRGWVGGWVGSARGRIHLYPKSAPGRTNQTASKTYPHACTHNTQNTHGARRELGAVEDLGGALPRQVDQVEGDVHQLVRV